MSLRNLIEVFKEAWPPKPEWTAENVPDLTGKVMLLTGGNTGIGKETAKSLLEHNARVYIACRSAEKAKAAVEDLKNATRKNDVHILIMDLSNLPTIKTGVDEFLKNESRLDVLFNSAGVMACPVDLLTKHGHDMQFGTNVLGHFYLTQLLLPILTASAKSSPDQHVRVVNVSSNGHWMAPTSKKGGPILYDTLVESTARKKLSTRMLYSQSKAGNILFSNNLARKYGSQGIVSTALNPGGIDSDLQRHGSSLTRSLVSAVFLYPLSYGSITPLYAGTAPEAAEHNGKYLSPWARLRCNREDLDEEEYQDKLWAWCEAEVAKFSF